MEKLAEIQGSGHSGGGDLSDIESSISSIESDVSSIESDLSSLDYDEKFKSLESRMVTIAKSLEELKHRLFEYIDRVN